MSKYQNLSDGKSDGFIILYVKDGKVKPIGLTESQASMLDLSLMFPFKDKGVIIYQDQVVNIKDGVIK